MAMMTITLHGWEKLRRNSNVSKVISYFIEHTQMCNGVATFKMSGFY